MQKLVYFAHGWHLALFDAPLLREEVQAWKFGPVISSLYQQFKMYGSGPILRPAVVWTQGVCVPASLEREGSADDVANAEAVINRVWEQYNPYSASQLTSLTHSPDSPWSVTPDKEQFEAAIPKSRIAEYFGRQVQR